MIAPSFEELIGDEDQFFEGYFGKAAFYRRSALRAEPAQLLSIEELDNILQSRTTRFPYVQVVRNGEWIPSDSFTRSAKVLKTSFSDSIDPHGVTRHIQTGATIVWNSLQHSMPKMRALASILGSALGDGECNISAILTPAGVEGFAPHCDMQEVFVIQLSGAKQWRIWPTPAKLPELRHYSTEELGSPLHQITVSPGDVIYIPTGTPHVAACDDSASLHLTADVVPKRWSHLLQQVVAAVLENDDSFSGLPRIGHNSTATLAARMTEQLAVLTQRLSHLNAHDELSRLLASENPASLPSLSDIVNVDKVSSDTRFRRNPSVEVEISEMPEGSSKAKVLIDGSEYEMPARMVRGLLDLGPGQEIRVGDFLGGADPDARVRVIKSLARIGVVQLCPAGAD